MDAKLVQGAQFQTRLMDSHQFSRRNSVSFLQFPWVKNELKLVSTPFMPITNNKNKPTYLCLKVSSSYKNFPVLESGTVHASSDVSLILKTKSQEVEPFLSGRCIYLVGMMGSGKTTVGKVLSQALGYSFCDCDTLIEQDMDGVSVAEIFNLYGEGFFRMKETDALKRLSMMHRMVVSTGGGAVIRPINWEYMHKGISVWLDVPLEALAQRIAAVGTDSRPLLHHESGDAYTKALIRLSTLFEEREECYANANARVSLESIAAKSGHRDICSITPTTIAIEALEQIAKFIEEEEGLSHKGI